MRALVVGLLVLVLFPSAAAHASLIASFPANASRMDVGASAFVFDFTEALDSALTTAVVQTADGSQVTSHVEVSAIRPSRMIVHTTPLEEGGYVVEWRVLSLDGHATRGASAYAVGSAAVPTIPDATASTTGPPWESIARGSFLAGLLLVTGMPITLRLSRIEDPAFRRRAVSVLLSAGVIGAAASLAYSAAFASQLGASLGAFAGTVAGQLILAQAAFAFGAAFCAYRALRRASGGLGGVATFGALALATHATTGHAIVSSGAAGGHGAHASLLAASVHLGAGAVWIGGVVSLALFMPGATPARALDALRRFSPWALVSVAAIALTGAYEAWATLPTWSVLVTTTYGRILLAKSALLLVLIGLGALQRFVFTRRLASATPTIASIQRSLWVEASLMGALVVLVGFLGASSPTGP